jgi:hypothetical protein
MDPKARDRGLSTANVEAVVLPNEVCVLTDAAVGLPRLPRV